MSAVPAAHPLTAVATSATGGAMSGQTRSEIRCRRCSYGGVVRRLPERCPMCGGGDWTTLPARTAPTLDARP